MATGTAIRKWGILGGSFDPVHNGHVRLAAAALDGVPLEKVLFIPAATPPHKQGRNLASAQDRLDMLKLALSHESRFRINDMEIARGGISFTLDTLKILAKTHPDSTFYFLIGSDSVAELATWHRIDRIAEEVVFVVLRREKRFRLATPAELEKALGSTPFRTILLEGEPLIVSSTDIRARVARGESIKGLVPKEVEDHIRKNNLYR